MSRPLLIVSILFVGLTAIACASVGGRSSLYATELTQLEDGCTARGGILIPAEIGRHDGRPQTDYACKINGGATRLGN